MDQIESDKPPVLTAASPQSAAYPRLELGGAAMLAKGKERPWWFYYTIISLYPIPFLSFGFALIGTAFAVGQLLRTDELRDPLLLKLTRVSLAVGSTTLLINLTIAYFVYLRR